MGLLVILCVLIILVNHPIWCREYEECRGITEPDTVVASKKSCAKYIFCDGENSYEGECLAGNYFNELEGNCDDPENVKCDIEPNDDVKSIYDEDFNLKEHETETTAENGDDNENITEIDEIDSEEIKENINSEMQQQNIPKCPQLNGFHNIKHIANHESCVAFYTCYNGIAIPMLCPGKMYFNEESSKCEPQMPESCKSRFSVRLNCHKGVYDFVPHPYRCEYYFYCLNGFLMIMRCPYDFTWHYERGTCVHKSKSKCYFEKSVIYNRDN
ncbi:probable chitinase 10 [Lucilia cuprina]|uniref:probable chitinase 10 n=1 Tax=Lucilia cuprina TaxID=7375 RepID=UPI001F055A6D|nr:probable chitinase 10 [Lucilia cuprina]